MGSTAWGRHNSTIAANSEDDFSQFLDMGSLGGMGGLGEGMQFDFQDFANGSASTMMNHTRNAVVDTIMGNSDDNGLMPSSNSMMQSQTSPMTTSMAQPSIPAHILTTSSETISSIDAQIQYLQQQKFQQQQRQIQEQQVAFFAAQNHSVPPTPQSLEMPSSTQFYSQTDQVSHQDVFDGRYQQRMKEQEVSGSLLGLSHDIS